VDTIILQAKKIVFVNELFSKAEASTPLGLAMSVSASSLIHAKKARILCYPRPHALKAKLYQSRNIHIDKPRSIEVECFSGSNDVRHAEIRLRSGSAGLRLRTSDTQVKEGIVTLKKATEPGVINLSAMSSDSYAVLQIPYDLESTLQSLSIRVEVKYETELGSFQFLALYNTPIDLPLDVNVHDTFRHDIFWPSFNIGPATGTPLAVADIKLEGSDIFQVSSPLPPGIKQSVQLPGCMATARRPRSYNFVITRKMSVEEAGAKYTKDKADIHNLPLTVNYECLDEVVLLEAEHFFSTIVRESPFTDMSELLVPNFVENLKGRLTPQDYERCVYEQGLQLDSFEEFPWSDTLDYLPGSQQSELREWLRKFHEVSSFV
jgi:trafficking protein particle complex subunit 10